MASYYLVDGTNLLYRAYHALQAFHTSRGVATHAAYGFTSMLFRVQREQHPDRLAVVFDPRGRTQKHELYEGYKATREGLPEDLAPQIAFVHRILHGMGLPVLVVEGYEADDVIGTLARCLEREGHEVTIVTGDKDFCQLVGPRVRLLDTMRDKVTGPPEVQERFGVGPELVVDLLCLTGDAIDNLPGVPGVGVKTAAQLLAKYGSLEAVVANAPNEKGKKGEALREHGQQALRNRPLITIDTAVPASLRLELLEPREMERGELAAIFRELEFHRFVKELGLGEEPPPGPPAVPAEGFETRPREAPPGWLGLVPGAFGEPWGVAQGVESGAFDLDGAGEPAGAWRNALASETVPVVGHGLKAARLALARRGLPLAGIRLDTEVAAYVLFPGRRDYLFEDLLRDRGLEPPPAELAPRERAAAAAAAALPLAAALEGELEGAGLLGLYREIENPLIPVLADMERQGVRVDSAALRAMSSEFAGRLSELEARIFELAGEPFSTQSPKQLARILFEKLKLPTGRRTATGYSTDAAVLEELALLHPLPALLLEHRGLAKLKSTFIDVLPGLVRADTGRIHAQFHQTVTTTGRLSSSGPNLQNIPVKGDEGRRIREAFVASEGRLLVSADYSQVELRILAHLCQDASLLEVFRSGRDVHAETASRIFGVALPEVDGRMRREAKTVNFGILYGMSPFGLARQLGISREAAARMIEAYFHQFPRVRAFLDGLVDRARERGYAETLFGRRRPIPEIRSRNRAQREFAERTAINTPIQGTAADLIKRAMVRAVEALGAERLDAALVLQVHDELVFEVAAADVERSRAAIAAAMEGAGELLVPLAVEVGAGTNWYEAH